MSRHIFDRRKAPEGGRLKHFVEVEKSHGEEGSHHSVKALHERPVRRNDTTKLREYFRIERGVTS